MSETSQIASSSSPEGDSVLAGVLKKTLTALAGGPGPLVYGHYGHNDGWTPVCGSRSDKPEYKGFMIFPSGAGIRPGRAWCPDCQRALQSIHGRESFQNPRDITREEWESETTCLVTLAELKALVKAACREGKESDGQDQHR